MGWEKNNSCACWLIATLDKIGKGKKCYVFIPHWRNRCESSCEKGKENSLSACLNYMKIDEIMETLLRGWNPSSLTVLKLLEDTVLGFKFELQGVNQKSIWYFDIVAISRKGLEWTSVEDIASDIEKVLIDFNACCCLYLMAVSYKHCWKYISLVLVALLLV